MEKSKIYLIGDSTCHTNNFDTFPQVGWGQVIGEYINSHYEVINLAQNGRSTKSFIDEGLFKPCEKSIAKGDYLFIQFGHNDEKTDEARHTDPFTTYQENLLFFVNIAKNVGAIPVLLSSIYRRHFDEKGVIEENCHLDYPKAMEELASKEDVIYIDMCELTKQKLVELGVDASKELFMNFDKNIYPNYPEGKEDNTHLREKGARMVCELLVKELAKNSITSKILKK
jgi:lysophospholipase L1-like esterase